MSKTLLLTGATDGIGLAAAEMLAPLGHTLLLHGRSAAKLDAARRHLAMLPGAGPIETFVADLSRLAEARALADAVRSAHDRLDVLINNAGVFNAAQARTADGLDLRFAVNTLAPYLLTRQLLPLLGTGRVVNVSSAAQAPVSLDALAGHGHLDDMAAYAQSKLALTMWSRHMAMAQGDAGPVIVAVNPGSMLGSKMVKQAFGVDGADLRIGADILARAALSDEFAAASGLYYDNDARRFGPPHPDALDARKAAALVRAMDAVLQAGAAQHRSH